ncbi:MAG: DUF554 domain-containing protein [Eubacteriales bacterium]|nr:DUF554 domain-containing protein [Eubacteriales bacterium]
MLGVFANPICVIIGAIVGVLLKGGIPERVRMILMQGIGLCVLLIGISGAVETANVMVVILSMVAGSVTGELLRIDDRLNAFGDWAQKKIARPGDSSFGQGFVSATLLFCVGSMAVVGALEAGLNNDPTILLAKTALDTVTSVVFASMLGIGVAFSAIPLLVYQGGMALLAGVLGPLMSEALIAEMSAVGSLLILALGLNMLGLTNERPIRVGNLLPSIFMPIAMLPLVEWLF